MDTTSNTLSASDQQQLLWWEQRLHNNRTLLNSGASSHHHHHHHPSTSNSDVMNQLCRVCGEPAAGFHFGAFTCEGCKSFFGRTYNNLSSISECKNGGQCVINKKNRTSCKACRLRKCLVVGMSKSGSRYGRRSNWFKIHCLLQEQSNNNNNNTIQQTVASHHLDSKLISSKNSDNSSSSWHHKKESSPVNHHPNPSSRNSSAAMLSDLRNFTGSNAENAASLAAAAAAFWASRGTTLLPHLPSSDLATSHQVPLSPFLASPFTNRNFLFPYLSPPMVPPTKPSTPVSNTNSPPPSSSTSSCCSSPNEKIPRIFEKEDALSGLALLRTLGPVQEQPMDLSVKNVPTVKSEHNSDSDDEEDVKGHNKVVSRSPSGSIKGESESGAGKLEHPGKPSTPLDLTNKI